MKSTPSHTSFLQQSLLIALRSASCGIRRQGPRRHVCPRTSPHLQCPPYSLCFSTRNSRSASAPRVNFRSLSSVDVNGPLCLDLTTLENTSAVVLFAPPLQAKPFIAKVSGRLSEKNPCIVWPQMGLGLIVGLGFSAAQRLYLLFRTTKEAALPFLGGLDFGSVLQILPIASRLALVLVFDGRRNFLFHFCVLWSGSCDR